MKIKAPAFVTAVLLFGFLLSGVSSISKWTAGDFFAPPAYSLDWQTEFDEVCSKTNDAASLSAAEVKTLIDRCDSLKPVIEKLDESTKKVYLKRLQMCRDMLVFTLESKENK